MFLFLIMILTSLSSINKPCTINAPGVKSVQLVRAGDVVFVPPAHDGQITQDIILRPDTVFSDIPFVSGSAVFEEPKTLSDGQGMFFNPSLRFALHKDRPELARLHLITTNRYYAAIITDYNNTKKFCPRLRARSDFSAGDSANRNQYSFILENPTPLPAQIFTGNITNA